MGLIYKNLEVITNDGYKIETWFFPAQSPLSEGELRDLNGNRRTYETQDETKRPTIIVCNGDAGNMSYFQLYLAKSWTSRGFNVVTFDWRGFGKSSPFAMDRNYLCYTEMLEDYRAVVRTTSEQEEVLNGAIAVVGWSTGAYLSMITAYTDDLVNAFVGRSLPTDFDDFIPLVMKYKNKPRNELLVPAEFHQLFGSRSGHGFDYFPAHPDGSAEIVLAYDQEIRRFHPFGHEVQKQAPQ